MQDYSYISKTIEILSSIKKKIKTDSDFLWTSYGDAKELNDEINLIIERLQNGDLTAMKDVYVHFLPTSTFQEHSLMNNWSEEYMKLASEFDSVYKKFKRNF